MVVCLILQQLRTLVKQQTEASSWQPLAFHIFIREFHLEEATVARVKACLA